MNIGTISRQALRAVASENTENKLLVTKKIVREIEDNPSEASHRLCQDLRSVLKSVVTDPGAAAVQVHEAGSILTRVKRFDPRRNKSTDEAISPELDLVKAKAAVAPVSDGFESGFLDIGSAIARVAKKYADRPRYTDLENERLLQVALGEIPLCANSAKQLWLALGYTWKARGGCFDSMDSGKDFADLMEPQAVWIQSAICSFANRNQVSLPTPSVFSILDDIAL